MATLPVNLFLAEVEDWSGEVAMLKRKKVGGVCVRMRIYHSAIMNGPLARPRRPRLNWRRTTTNSFVYFNTLATVEFLGGEGLLVK